MNLNTVRRIIIGALLIVSAGLAAYAADLRWQDTLDGKVVEDVSVQLPGGDVQYGPYCTLKDNGKKLEGGGICHVVERTVAYTRPDAIAETIGVGIFVLVVVGGGSWAVVTLTFARIARARSRRVAEAAK